VNLNRTSISTSSPNPGTITVSAGGNITLTNSSIAANGTGTGSGGTITLSNQGASINIGAGSTIQALGGNLSGNGGTVTVNAAGTLTGAVGTSIDVSGRGTSANGGTMTISAGTSGTGDMTITGSLQADAGTVGTGGTIQLSNTNGAINVQSNTGSEVITARGGTISGDGNMITVSTAGIIHLAGSSISTSARGTGNGGTIQVSGDIMDGPTEVVTSDGSNGKGGKLVFNPSGAVANIDQLLEAPDLGASGNGSGGTVTINSTAQILNISSKVISADAAKGTNGAGGNITVQTVNCDSCVINFSATTVSASGQGSGSGGAIQLNAPVLNFLSPVAISANGGIIGNGGSVTIQSTGSKSSLVIGGGSAPVRLSATGGSSGSQSGNGGTVEVDAGSNLKVDLTAITVNPLGEQGNGGNVLLVAGFDTKAAGSSAQNPQYSTRAAGTLTITDATMDDSGVGNGAGGAILAIGPVLSFGGDTINFTANGAGNGAGGTVFVDAAGINSTTKFSGTINTLGGPSGGAGGTASVKGEGVLKFAGLTVNASAQGGDSKGGSITIGGNGDQTQQGSAFVPPTSISGTFTLTANGNGAGTGGSILVDGNDLPNINATINANSGQSNAAGGTIQITSEIKSIQGTIIATARGSSTSQNVGGITLTAQTLISLTDSTLSVSGQSEIAGARAGAIQLSSVGVNGTIKLINPSLLSVGDRGSITLNSVGPTTITNGGMNSSEYVNNGDIGAGSVSITSGGKLSIGCGILAQGDNQGTGGKVAISGAGISIQVTNLSIFSSGSTAQNVTITSTGNIDSNDGGTLISIMANGISADGSTGKAGNITITATGSISVPTLTLNAAGANAGNAGNITVQGSSIQQSDGDGVALTATATNYAGKGATITITATSGDLNLAQTTLTGANVESDTASAGTIIISAPKGTITINTAINADALSSFSSTTGELAGMVTITGNNISINSPIDASGVNGGGTITANARHNLTISAPVTAYTDPNEISNNSILAPGTPPQTGGTIILSGGGLIAINRDVYASDNSPQGLLSVPSTQSTINISGTQATTLTIAAGVKIEADLQNGVTTTGLANTGPKISISDIGTINLAGTLESVTGTGSLGQINITNSGKITINNAQTLQGNILGNSTNISSSSGSVNVFLGSITALSSPYSQSLVPSTSVSGSAATGFTLTVLNENMTLGSAQTAATAAIQSTKGNINLSLLNSGTIQINSTIQAADGDVTISNLGGPLNINSITSSNTVTGNKVSLRAGGDITANGTFKAVNGSLFIDTTNPTGTISLGGSFFASGAQLTISVGQPPTNPTPGASQLTNNGKGQVFWNNSNSANFVGAAATITTNSSGTIDINPSAGRILLSPFTNLTAVSYVVPGTSAGLGLSSREIEQIGHLLFHGHLSRGNDIQHLILTGGELFLHPKHDTEVDCGESIVHVRGNSCALIERTERGLRIYCLADRRWNGSIIAESKLNGARSLIQCGQRLIIGRNQSSLEALRTDNIGERCVRSTVAQFQTISEFSIPGLLKEHRLLKEFRNTTNHCAQVTYNQILTMAAALNIVQSSHGAYRIRRRGQEA